MNSQIENIPREPIGRIMAKISRMYLSKLQSGLSHLDIERSYYPLLIIDNQKNISQQKLAEILMVDKVQVVRIIDYLSTNGYVERFICQTDRRKCELRATEKAQKEIPKIKQVIENTSLLAFNNLSTMQVDDLYRIISIIEKNLSNIDLENEK